MADKSVFLCYQVACLRENNEALYYYVIVRAHMSVVIINKSPVENLVLLATNPRITWFH